LHSKALKEDSPHKQKLADVTARLKRLREAAGEFEQLKRARQVEEARLLCDEAYDLYDRKSDRVEEADLWSDAADFFHWIVDNAYPPDFDERFEELRRGEASGLETAVKFLEDDPWMFRSGYMKAYLIKFTIRMRLSEEQAIRLRKAVINAIGYRDRREFRWYCKLAKKVQDKSFRTDVEQLIASDDAGVRRRARWVLSAITHNKTFHMNRGMRQYRLENYADAIGDFNRTLLLEPASARAYLWRGMACAKLKKFEEAISDLTLSIDVSNAKYPERFNYKRNGRHLMWMRFPKYHVTAYRWMGWVYAEQLDYSKAERAYSQALEISPKDSLAFCGRGRARCNQKDFDNAITDLEQSVELDATNYEPHFLLGVVYYERGAYDLTAAALLRALELKPENFDSHVLLSQAYFNLSKYQEAFDAAVVATELQNDSSVGLCCRGKASFKLGESEKAIASLTQSIEINPTLHHGEHFYWRAQARAAIGEKELAEADRKASIGAGFKMEDG